MNNNNSKPRFNAIKKIGFYTTGILMSIRIPRLGKTPTLYRYWLSKVRKGLI